MDTRNNNFKETVFLFLEGKLSRREENELLKWIKKDTRHKQLFIEEQETLREKVIQSKNTRLDLQWKKLESRVSEVNQKEEFKTKRIAFTHKRIISIAAAFVLGLFISGIFYVIMSRNLPGNSVVQEVSIPYGAKTNFMLPDGSVVWLNSGSSLSFPMKYKDKRTVKLEGEAFFEVVKSGQPFVVTTSYGEIEVLGTKFNVKAYHDDAEFQTTLVEGSVKINRPSQSPVVLKPDQLAYWDESNKLVMQKVNTELYTSWRDGKLIFYREPFGKVAKRFERWYNVNIEIDNDEMKDLWFTGTIEMETFSEVMDLISKSLPITYSYNQATRTMKIDKK